MSLCNDDFFLHKDVYLKGAMPEWLMGTDCKSVGFAYAGSNPARLILYKKKL